MSSAQSASASVIRRPRRIISTIDRELVTVDISDLVINNDPRCVLATYALGSCVAVMVHDGGNKVGGMIHFMLPHSKTAPDKARLRPGMFADTGVPLLFHRMYQFGCRKEDLRVVIAGGGCLQRDRELFNIGRRNITALRKLLWKNAVIVAGEDLGGSKSRTTQLDVNDGTVVVRSDGKERIL